MGSGLSGVRPVRSAGRVYLEVQGTWTPKVCRIMACVAIIMGLGLLFFMLLGLRYS